MEQVESKEYSWTWVTADRLLSHGACEICMLCLTCDGANGNATIYDGENNTGDVIMVVKGLQNRTVDVCIPHHIYCRRGIYIVLSPAVFGIFVQWRELGHRGEGG